MMVRSWGCGRRWAAGAALIASVIAFSGCGSNASSTGTASAPSSASTSRPVTTPSPAAASTPTSRQAASTSAGRSHQSGDAKNIADIEGFVQDQQQSMWVTLVPWGRVRFVSGTITGGSHVPTVFYLTDASGNILYDFSDSPFPYRVKILAVTFEDLNHDGLDDMVVLVGDEADAGRHIAAVWIANGNKTFSCDVNLYRSMNLDGRNADIASELRYLTTSPQAFGGH